MGETREAGRELDALVARRVFSIGRRITPVVVGPAGHTRELWWKFGDELSEHPPEFSTDIAAAFRVVEKMRTTYLLDLVDDGNSFSARFCVPLQSPPRWVRCDTAPLAICLAALNALDSARSSRGGEDA